MPQRIATNKHIKGAKEQIELALKGMKPDATRAAYLNVAIDYLDDALFTNEEETFRIDVSSVTDRAIMDKDLTQREANLIREVLMRVMVSAKIFDSVSVVPTRLLDTDK